MLFMLISYNERVILFWASTFLFNLIFLKISKSQLKKSIIVATCKERLDVDFPLCVWCNESLLD